MNSYLLISMFIMTFGIIIWASWQFYYVHEVFVRLANVAHADDSTHQQFKDFIATLIYVTNQRSIAVLTCRLGHVLFIILSVYAVLVNFTTLLTEAYIAQIEGGIAILFSTLIVCTICVARMERITMLPVVSEN